MFFLHSRRRHIDRRINDRFFEEKNTASSYWNLLSKFTILKYKQNLACSLELVPIQERQWMKDKKEMEERQKLEILETMLVVFEYNQLASRIANLAWKMSIPYQIENIGVNCHIHFLINHLKSSVYKLKFNNM